MGRPPKTGYREQTKMAKNLDKLRRFEEFENSILPELQKDLKQGMSSRDLASKYSRFAMARLITEALTNTNANLAKGAAKDIVEFGDGKATEKKEVSHRLEKLKGQQLDALLLTELSEVQEGERDENS